MPWNTHESLVFSRYIYEPLGECVYQEKTSDKLDIPWYTTRKRRMTISYHAIENTVDSTKNGKYAQTSF